MKFSDEDMLHLTGKKFSNGYKLSLKYDERRTLTRINCLVDIMRNKKVLHIGCCDHVPLIEKKIKKRQWLHGLLLENCSLVAGVDINDDSVQYVISSILPVHYSGFKENPSFSNIYSGDITRAMPEALRSIDFDFAIMGEILEHVNNPVQFLIETKKCIDHNVKKIIITVPNALRFRLDRPNELRYECINSDHRYWFTPYTIAKVCIEAGIYPEDLFFVDPVPRRGLVGKIARKSGINTLGFYDRIISHSLVFVGSLVESVSDSCHSKYYLD